MQCQTGIPLQLTDNGEQVPRLDCSH